MNGNGYVRWPALISTIMAISGLGAGLTGWSFSEHSRHPHSGAVTQELWTEMQKRIDRMSDRIDENSDKLDRILDEVKKN